MDMNEAAGTMRVRTVVNGRARQMNVEPRMHLADALRNELGITGPKLGCEQGICGSCTILVDGQPMRSCLMLAVQADGCELRTVESLADGARLGVLQDAFRRHHALQCGFCTAGFLSTATAFLKSNPQPTRAEVRDVLSGNLCRCTGYETIVDAILDPEVLAAAAQGELP